MPTGYTASIKDGISFNDFVWRCARAFGALILMRDESQDKPIPEKFEPSDYHKKKIPEIREKLEWLSGLSNLDAKNEAEKEYKKKTNENMRYIEEANDLKIKYKAMLLQVREWQPPTPDHTELKEFMIEQIKSSIDHDCNNDYWLKNQPVLLTTEQWLSQKRETLMRDLQYHIDENMKEIERTNGRNQWIKKLKDSL